MSSKTANNEIAQLRAREERAIKIIVALRDKLSEFMSHEDILALSEKAVGKNEPK